MRKMQQAYNIHIREPKGEAKEVHYQIYLHKSLWAYYNSLYAKINCRGSSLTHPFKER